MSSVKAFHIIIGSVIFSKVNAFMVTCENWDQPCPAGEPITDCFVDLCDPDPCGNDDETCHMNFCEGCQTVCCVEPKCSDEVLICPDGKTVVEQDPQNNCEFKPCEDASSIGGNANTCDDDQLLCFNGYTYVSRDPENDCEFFPCPDRHRPTCRDDTSSCPDSVPMFDDICLYDPCEDGDCPTDTTCVSNYCGGCHALCCSEEAMLPCNDDTKLCPDGVTVVDRNPENEDCDFFACPSSNTDGATNCRGALLRGGLLTNSTIQKFQRLFGGQA